VWLLKRHNFRNNNLLTLRLEPNDQKLNFTLETLANFCPRIINSLPAIQMIILKYLVCVWLLKRHNFRNNNLLTLRLEQNNQKLNFTLETLANFCPWIINSLPAIQMIILKYLVCVWLLKRHNFRNNNLLTLRLEPNDQKLNFTLEALANFAPGLSIVYQLYK
jgi:hypothetical protein